jgi:hypothetical protein
VYETEPTEVAINEIRAHLNDAHGRLDLDVERDIVWPGHDPAGARVVFLPESPSRHATFRCADCPARIFPAGLPSDRHPGRNAFLRAASPEARSTVATLRGAGDLDRIVGAWESGAVGKAVGVLVERQEAQATKRADRPVVEERRANVQGFLLAEVRAGATVTQAIERFDELRRDDFIRYVGLLGGETYRSTETVRKDWHGIDIAVRNLPGPDRCRHPCRVMTLPLDRLLSVDDLMARYGLRDRRTARVLMHTIGAIRIGRRLFVQSEDVARYEAAHRAAPAPPRRPGPDSHSGLRTPRMRASELPSLLPAGWWRQPTGA